MNSVCVTPNALSHFWDQTSRLSGRSVWVALPFSLLSATVPPLEDNLLMTRCPPNATSAGDRQRDPRRPAPPRTAHLARVPLDSPGDGSLFCHSASHDSSLVTSQGKPFTLVPHGSGPQRREVELGRERHHTGGVKVPGDAKAGSLRGEGRFQWKEGPPCFRSPSTCPV